MCVCVCYHRINIYVVGTSTIVFPLAVALNSFATVLYSKLLGDNFTSVYLSLLVIVVQVGGATANSVN